MASPVSNERLVTDSFGPWPVKCFCSKGDIFFCFLNVFKINDIFLNMLKYQAQSEQFSDFK